jgi:AcrR family transcriptional regulator
VARTEEILHAAADLFHQQGYHATTVADIATAVGLKKGSLYHYITGKELLLRTLAEDTIRGYLEDAECIAGEPGSAALRLRDLIRAHLGRVCAAPERVTVLVREAHYVPEPLRRDVEGMTRRYTRLVARLVAEGIEAGEFAPIDPMVVALMLLGALNWTHRWYQRDGRLRPEEIADQCAALFIGGLSVREGGNHAGAL